MHDRGIVVRATAADVEPGFTVPAGNDHVGISVWALMLVPQTDGMADLVDRGSDAAALGVHEPDRLRTALAADLCNARAMIWFKRFGAETDEVRLDLARHQLHDRLRVPVTDRLFDISPSPFRETRLDNERDDSLWPEQLGSRWNRSDIASGYPAIPGGHCGLAIDSRFRGGLRHAENHVPVANYQFPSLCVDRFEAPVHTPLTIRHPPLGGAVAHSRGCSTLGPDRRRTQAKPSKCAQKERNPDCPQRQRMARATIPDRHVSTNSQRTLSPMSTR